jgi:hypothetical protein
MSSLDQLLAGDEIGAAKPRTRAPGSVPSGVQKNQSSLRKTFAGIAITTITTLTSSDVKCDVLEPFRMDRMVLSAAAQALHVANIRVGTKPLNVSGNPISGNAFSEQAVNSELSGYTAQPGTGITLSVYNSTGASVVLSGGFLGWAAL